VSSDLFHSNLTASTSKHSELFAGLDSVAAFGATGPVGPGVSPPPLFPPSALPEQEASAIEKTKKA